MRKTWMKPTLVVLVKGTPDEKVLQDCKGSYPWAGPGSQKDTCNENDRYCGPCEKGGSL